LTFALAFGTVSPVTCDTDIRHGDPHEGDLPAGDFGVWLERMRVALRLEADADVPCGDCCACCSTSHFVHIGPDETETLAQVPGELLFEAPGMPGGHVVLPFDARGRCPLLDETGRCTIYARRPLTCRTYDCRVFAAAGIDADREEIGARARRWRFACSSPGDTEQLAAVAEAARWIPGHAAAFPGGEVPQDPVQLAVLAVRVAGVFAPGGPASTAVDDASVAAAVVEAAR
jgi:Fe-S-cluster containining protein